MRGGEIRSLTGLRGVAAIVVMGFHLVMVPTSASVSGWSGRPAGFGPGYLMVDLFFILSGFVMARTYGTWFQEGVMPWQHYRSFLEARFARVYPLYFIITVGVFLLTKMHAMTSASFPIRAVMSNVPLVQNLGAGWIAPGFAEYLVPPGWSISTEAAAYLLFPILARLALFRSPGLSAAVFVVAWLALFALSILPREWLLQDEHSAPLDISSGDTLWPVLRCLAGFTVGLCLQRAATLLEARRRWPAMDLVLLGTVAGLWLVPDADFPIVSVFPLLILQLCTDRSPMAQLLGSAVPHRLGQWSYAIYLLHWPALSLLPPIFACLGRFHMPHAQAASLFLLAAIIVGASALIFNLVERPARSLIRRWLNERRTPIGMEPSAP